MNTNYPHELVSIAALAFMPKARRATFRPVPKKRVELLAGTTPDERAEWLAKNPLPQVDVELMLAAQAKRERKAAAKRARGEA